MIPTIALIFTGISLFLALVGLIYKISSFATKQEQRNTRHDQRLNALYTIAARVPLIEYRLSGVEKHLGLSVPDMPPTLHGDAEE